MAPKRKKNVKRNPGVKKGKKHIEIEIKQELIEVELKKPNEMPSVDLSKEKLILHSCKKCNKNFRFLQSFRDHVANEHSKLKNSVPCKECPVRCPNNNVLQEHIEKVHKRKIYNCPKCMKVFVRNSHVLRHMDQSGCNGQGAAIYPCEICPAKFTRKDNLMVHLRQQHIMKKEHACKVPSCAYSTQSFNKLIIHVQNKHTDQPSHFECDHCGKVASSRAAMSKHLEIHGEKKYECDVCGYASHTVEVMRRHVLTHVADKPYKCGVCCMSFIQRIQLNKHMERHAGKMCTDCGKSCRSIASLVNHAKQHKKKLLLCTFDECPRSKNEFPDQATLDEHLKNHQPPKVYKCEVCDKRFSSELNMRRHVTSHMLERPRRCMYCLVARAYVRGMQLVRHVRKCHPAVFRDHLAHVRRVLGQNVAVGRVQKSELEAILNVLDAEADRILQGYGEGVLYGGMQETDEPPALAQNFKSEENPLMSEEELVRSVGQLLAQMIDKDTLECFGWPGEAVDVVLEKVIEHCGAKVADRVKWTRVQCLRENAKHLFLYVIEDKTIARMLNTHTIDQIIKDILAQVTEDDPLS